MAAAATTRRLLRLSLTPSTRPFLAQPAAGLHKAAAARDHDYASPCGFLGSWDPPSLPEEAEARLDRLRKEYERKMKQVRKECAHDVEMLRIEKERKDEARREAARVANLERKAAKAAAKQSLAAQRKAFQEDFRQTLMKERAEKLESWRAKEELREKKKEEKKDLLRRKSSLWIAEAELEQRVTAAIVDTTQL